MSIKSTVIAIMLIAATNTVFSQLNDSISLVTIEIPLASVPDSTAKPLQISDSTKSASSETDIKEPQGMIPIPSLKPIVSDTTGRGALHVKVYPSNASIFLNSIYVGNGNRTVKNLQTGIYTLDLIHENDTLTDLIKIDKNVTTELDLSVSRWARFSVETSFGMFSYNKQMNYGPALDLGVQYRNNYFGIDYYWGFGDFVTFGGAAVKYRYAIHNSSTVKIAPEIVAGFWYSEYFGYYDYRYSDDREYEDGLFFGGPGCSFKFGYKWVFFNVESIFLIGNNISHLLKTGFCVFF